MSSDPQTWYERPCGDGSSSWWGTICQRWSWGPSSREALSKKIRQTRSCYFTLVFIGGKYDSNYETPKPRHAQTSPKANPQSNYHASDRPEEKHTRNAQREPSARPEYTGPRSRRDEEPIRRRPAPEPDIQVFMESDDGTWEELGTMDNPNPKLMGYSTTANTSNRSPTRKVAEGRADHSSDSTTGDSRSGVSSGSTRTPSENRSYSDNGHRNNPSTLETDSDPRSNRWERPVRSRASRGSQRAEREAQIPPDSPPKLDRSAEGAKTNAYVSRRNVDDVDFTNEAGERPRGSRINTDRRHVGGDKQTDRRRPKRYDDRFGGITTWTTQRTYQYD